ncbi:MAG: LysE family translocator protein [uncultured bacterium]|nr:MAG: LysE family translocator protein [uncultured bacterium]HBH18394.1 lysine transporter LysE [Cyanobacteria bacterium UBA9579]
MELNLLLDGLIIGFLAAAPVGPIGILCINTTLNKGRSYGLAVGLGSACADIIFALIAGFGLTIIIDFLTNYSSWIKITGGIFLIYLGVRIFMSKPVYRSKSLGNKSYLSIFILGFILTLISPMSIILFISLYAPVSLSDINRSHLSVYTLATGVFIGAMLWWITLSSLTNLLRGRINTAKLSIVNRISGVIIVGFGGYEILSTLKILINPN